jgi:hypothetical protein
VKRRLNFNELFVGIMIAGVVVEKAVKPLGEGKISGLTPNWSSRESGRARWLIFCFGF